MQNLLAVVFLVFGFHIASANTGISGGHLSLKDFINLAEKNDPNFENILSEKKRAEFLVDQGMPTREFLISIRSEFGYSNQSGQTSQNTSVNQTTTQATVSKNILETGTSLSLTQDIVDRVDRNEHVTQFRVNQSLYRNFLGRNSRLLEKSLVKKAEVIKLEVQESYEQYLKDISDVYLNYSLAQLNYDLSQTIYKEVLNFEQNVKRRLSKNVARSTDADRARLQVILRKEDMLEKRVALESAWQEVKKIIGDAASGILKPLTHINLESKYKDYLNTRQDLQILRPVQAAFLKKKSALQAQTYQGRQNQPLVNLVAGFNIDRSKRFNTPVNREEFVVGLQVEIPLGDTLAKAKVKNAALQTMQANLEIESLKNTLSANFDKLQMQLGRAKEQLSLAKKKVSLTKRILEDQERRYTYARVTLNNLIDLRNDYAEYRFQYQKSLMTYNRIILDWVSLNDKLL